MNPHSFKNEGRKTPEKDYLYLHKLLLLMSCLREKRNLIRCLNEIFSEIGNPLTYSSDKEYIQNIFLQVKNNARSILLLQAYLLLLLFYERNPENVIAMLESFFNLILEDISIENELYSSLRSLKIKFYLVTSVFSATLGLTAKMLFKIQDINIPTLLRDHSLTSLFSGIAIIMPILLLCHLIVYSIFYMHSILSILPAFERKTATLHLTVSLVITLILFSLTFLYA